MVIPSRNFRPSGHFLTSARSACETMKAFKAADGAARITGAAASAASAGALGAFVPTNALPAGDPAAAAPGAPAHAVFGGAEYRGAVLPGLVVAVAAGSAPTQGAPASASSHLSNGRDLRAFYKPLLPVASPPQVQANRVTQMAHRGPVSCPRAPPLRGD